MVSEVNALEMRQQRAFDVEDLLSRMCPLALMISQPQIGICRFVVFLWELEATDIAKSPEVLLSQTPCERMLLVCVI